MLTGTKKTQRDGQDWFVVLNPLKSEIEKRQISKEIAKAFRLPISDTLDLIANTPIILLDNLLYATACQIKQYFQSCPNEVVVSNDSFLKRRCYRTVWPQTPSLSFLRDMPQSKDATKCLDGDEAIREIRSWGQAEGILTSGKTQESDIVAPTSVAASKRNGRHFRDILEEEREKLLKENNALRESLDQLRANVEKFQTEIAERNRAVENAKIIQKQREKEALELHDLVSQAEEKYELLREEFRQTRRCFEEKVVLEGSKSEDLLKRIEEHEMSKNELSREKQAVIKSFEALKIKMDRVLKENEAARFGWEEQRLQLQREIESQKNLSEGLREKVKNLEEGKKIVQQSETRLLEELEKQTQDVKRWEQKAVEFEKEARNLKRDFEDKENTWKVRLAELEAREHDLENARRQIRELHREMERKEKEQKKKELQERLLLKETQLKQVVQSQEKIESEIRLYEEEMTKLLSEQETIEREIIEIKQIERHLAEKTKKENLGDNGRIRLSDTVEHSAGGVKGLDAERENG